MKIFSSKKRVAAIGVVTAATLVGGGMAVAYWTTTGSGAGSATTGTSSKFVVDIVSTDATVVPLAPGNGTQNFRVTVTNPASAGVQRLNSVDVTVAGRDGTSGLATLWDPPGDCSAADYTVSDVVPELPADFGDDLTPGAPWTGTFTVDMNETGMPQDDCKNLPVPLHAAAS